MCAGEPFLHNQQTIQYYLVVYGMCGCSSDLRTAMLHRKRVNENWCYKVGGFSKPVVFQTGLNDLEISQ